MHIRDLRFGLSIAGWLIFLQTYFTLFVWGPINGLLQFLKQTNSNISHLGCIVNISYAQL